VRGAIRSLMRDLLTRKDTLAASVQRDSLIEEIIEMEPGEQIQWCLSLYEGDYVSGIVDEVDGEPLNIYFMNRPNYVKMKNDEDFEFYGGEGVGAYELNDLYVEENGEWYLVLHNSARLYGREVLIELVRLHYE
ncbi:MAG: hypothetical protein ACE5IO_06980, partial [Thermoplasmata archaeon]